MKNIVFVATLLALAGCSSSAVPVDKAKTATADRAFKFQAPKKGDAQLTVVRDSGIVGSGCYAAIFINGQKSALLNASEKVTFSLPGGEYEVGAAFDGAALCSVGKERQERTVTLSTDQKKIVRVYSDSDANLDIKPSTL
ncbi:hypothetical protein [Erwinia sp. Leaf53]|uniref:hypothetical protein n=1 Tax=Erwinia sp. Leaf53 TaxID=1736225 RepID=UPI00070105DC|nr:hypothetical protein [Erwinia sp. Leaf53]KQN63619.1 hypothetical protein ASF13_18755 [Erwinia sp. Leaf53]